MDKIISPKFRKTKLENGLTIVTESIVGRASVHLGLHLLWGSRNEPKHMAGAAHLIEHMVFKGTEKRTAFDLAMEIESVGGELGASTGKEVTSYTVQCLEKDLNLGIDILADLGLNAKFTEEEFLKEKEVVLSEIDMTLENFEESVFDFSFSEIYGEHPLGRPILGTVESVESIKCEELFKLYKKIYSPQNMLLSVSGDVDHDEIVKEAGSFFKGIKTNENSSLEHNSLKESKGIFEGTTKFIEKNSEQAHVLISFEAPPFVAKNRYLAYLASLALGGGMTSLLYQKIREDLGLAYSVYSYLQCFLKEGVLSIYVGTKPEKALEVVGLVVDEVEGLAKNGFDEKQLELYKQQLLGEILMGQDDLDSRMNSIALNEMIFGEYRPPEKVAAEINQIDIKQMNEYFADYFTRQPGVMILGPRKS